MLMGVVVGAGVVVGVVVVVAVVALEGGGCKVVVGLVVVVCVELKLVMGDNVEGLLGWQGVERGGGVVGVVGVGVEGVGADVVMTAGGEVGADN